MSSAYQQFGATSPTERVSMKRLGSHQPERDDEDHALLLTT